MRSGTKFLIFFIILFSINVVFYYVSEDYRFFLKKLKNSDEVVYLEEKKVSDDDPAIKAIQEDVQGDEEIVEKDDTIVSIESSKNKIEPQSEIVLGKNYQEILNLFSGYDFSNIDLNTNLFDLTDEYPDEYYEYYTSKLTIYLFPTKIYPEVLDIFKLLESDLPFTLNEINNFGDKSVYINLKEDIDDNFVRLIIENNGIAFGLKIKKDEYNTVKQKLDTLRK